MKLGTILIHLHFVYKELEVYSVIRVTGSLALMQYFFFSSPILFISGYYRPTPTVVLKHYI